MCLGDGRRKLEKQAVRLRILPETHGSTVSISFAAVSCVCVCLSVNHVLPSLLMDDKVQLMLLLIDYLYLVRGDACLNCM